MQSAHWITFSWPTGRTRVRYKTLSPPLQRGAPPSLSRPHFPPRPPRPRHPGRVWRDYEAKQLFDTQFPLQRHLGLGVPLTRAGAHIVKAASSCSLPCWPQQCWPQHNSSSPAHPASHQHPFFPLNSLRQVPSSRTLTSLSPGRRNSSLNSLFSCVMCSQTSSLQRAPTAIWSVLVLGVSGATRAASERSCASHRPSHSFLSSPSSMHHVRP